MESNTRCLLKDSSNSRWKTISITFWENQIQYLLKEQWEHVENQMHCLNLIWVGFLGVSFEVGGQVKLPPHTHTPCLEPVRIMLETWNLVRKHIHICGFRDMPFSHQAPLDFANINIFLQKKTAIILPLLKTILWARAVLEFFSPVFSFCKIKGYC